MADSTKRDFQQELTRAYQNGRFDAERELFAEVREARDKTLGLFGYGVLCGMVIMAATCALVML